MGGSGSSSGKGGSSGGAGGASVGKSLNFTTQQSLGLGGTILNLSNGDSVSLGSISGMDRGTNIKQLSKTADMEQHFTESFIVKGIGGKSYTYTREVTIYDRKAKVKGSKFQVKHVGIKTA